MKTTLGMLALVPLLAVVACTEPEAAEPEAGAEVASTEAASAPTADPAAARQEIDAVNQRFEEALNRGDANAATQAVYTQDARILPPDMATIEGRDNIAQFWAGGLQQMGIRDVDLTTDELEVSGDMAYEQGRFRFNTGQGPAQGKYMVVWKRTPEGWRWHRDIWNMSPAEG